MIDRFCDSSCMRSQDAMVVCASAIFAKSIAMLLSLKPTPSEHAVLFNNDHLNVRVYINMTEACTTLPVCSL